MPNTVQIVFNSARCPEREFVPWVAQLAGEIAADGRVQSHSLRRLHPACDRFPAAADWLIELRLAPGTDPVAFTNDGACAVALADLYQLRLHPKVQVVRAAA